MAFATCVATIFKKRRPLRVDTMIPDPKIIRDELANFFAERSIAARTGWHLERRRQEDLMLLTLFAILTFSVLYWFPIRRRMSRWGAQCRPT